MDPPLLESTVGIKGTGLLSLLVPPVGLVPRWSYIADDSYLGLLTWLGAVINGTHGSASPNPTCHDDLDH